MRLGGPLERPSRALCSLRGSLRSSRSNRESALPFSPSAGSPLFSLYIIIASEASKHALFSSRGSLFAALLFVVAFLRSVLRAFLAGGRSALLSLRAQYSNYSSERRKQSPTLGVFIFARAIFFTFERFSRCSLFSSPRPGGKLGDPAQVRLLETETSKACLYYITRAQEQSPTGSRFVRGSAIFTIPSFT